MDYEKFNYKEALEGAKKKYNEALERAKKLQETCDNPSVVGWCEYIFPQLRVSEDERIRKAIHIYLDWLDGRKDYAPKGEYSIKDMLAWLNKQEKQSVQKPFDYENANIQQTDFTPKIEQKSQRIISAEAKEAMYDKPWSEEDENMLNLTLGLLSYHRQCRNWLKSLKDRVGCEANCTTTKEWSEEDKKNLQGIIDEIEANKNQAPDYDLATYDRFLTWLKSLRPQNGWKPSDEQIEILDMVLSNESMDDNVARILRELREQLKKLRGE